MSYLPDGLIFEYDLDRKGIHITCTQSELVKCRHCKHAQSTYMFADDNPYRFPLKCEITNAFVREEHFCASADKISD